MLKSKRASALEISLKLLSKTKKTVSGAWELEAMVHILEVWGPAAAAAAAKLL